MFEIDQLGCRKALECVFVCLQYFFTVHIAALELGLFILSLFVFLQTSTAAQHSTAQKRGFRFPFLSIFARLVFSCSSINRLFVTYLLAYWHTASVHTYIGGMKAYSSFGLSLPCLPACLPIFQFFREKTSFFLPTFVVRTVRLSCHHFPFDDFISEYIHTYMTDGRMDGDMVLVFDTCIH